MAHTMTGARVIFRINSQKIAYASNVSYNENIATERINVLDNLASKELAETGYEVDFSCTNFVNDENTIKDLGIMPKYEEILKRGVLKAEIIDHNTEKVLLLLTGCKLIGRSGSVDARGVFSETWNFQGIKEES